MVIRMTRLILFSAFNFINFRFKLNFNMIVVVLLHAAGGRPALRTGSVPEGGEAIPPPSAQKFKGRQFLGRPVSK